MSDPLDTDGNTKRVAQAYDGIAAGYDREMVRSRWIRPVLWSLYGRAFPHAADLIDAGCGTGEDTIHLARAGHRIMAIDASAAMLDQLRAKLNQNGGPLSVTMKQGSIGAFRGLPTGEFDGIVSAFCGLNTLESFESFAGEASRVLRSHGKMVLHLLHPSHGLPLLPALSVAVMRKPLQRVFEVAIAGVGVRHRAVQPIRSAAEFSLYFECESCHFLGSLSRVSLAMAPRFFRRSEDRDSFPRIVSAAQRWLRPQFYVLMLTKRGSSPSSIPDLTAEG